MVADYVYATGKDEILLAMRNRLMYAVVVILFRICRKVQMHFHLSKV